MLRLDVVYFRPIDIWKVGQGCHIDMFRKRKKCPKVDNRDSNNSTTSVGGEDLQFIDHKNEYAVIPGFRNWPVNDRMIYGPYDAEKVWASERFERAQSHVMETQVINPLTG